MQSAQVVGVAGKRSDLGKKTGRKQVIGRPILYKTTKEFLMRFGLKDINELPSMEEFEKLASEALQLGLVDRVVAAEELADGTAALARAIAAAPPAVIADIKRALAASGTLEQQIAMENEHQLRAFASAEARQRIMAFLKRS